MQGEPGRALIAAFEARDAKAAEQAARFHIEHSRTLAIDRLMQGFASVALS
jgi:DNA-binding GntR family transcriptional regulator